MSLDFIRFIRFHWTSRIAVTVIIFIVCFEAALRLDGDILLETDFTLASHGKSLREATSKHLYSPVQNTAWANRWGVSGARATLKSTKMIYPGRGKQGNPRKNNGAQFQTHFPGPWRNSNASQLPLPSCLEAALAPPATCFDMCSAPRQTSDEPEVVMYVHVPITIIMLPWCLTPIISSCVSQEKQVMNQVMTQVMTQIITQVMNHELPMSYPWVTKNCHRPRQVDGC